MKIKYWHFTDRRLGEMKVSRTDKRSGFSLVEVLIALTVLAVGILVIAQMQAAAIRGLAFSRHLSVASQIAESLAEVLRSLPYDPTQPNTAPTVNGVAYQDSQLKSVLYDDNLGDANYGPWLYYTQPRNEMLQAKTPNSGGQDYYLRWRCMWGIPTNVAVSIKPYPGPSVPGVGQIQIQIQVIWWEKAPPSTPDLTVDDTTIRRNSGTNDGHIVTLTTTRDMIF